MIRIAICADEREVRSSLSALIEKLQLECNITEYASAKACLADKGQMDILLLDLDMKGRDTDGITLARKIRQSTDKQPFIIVVTKLEEYVYAAFEIKAFQYLLKPVNEKQFAATIKNAMAEIQKNEKRQKIRSIHIQYADTVKTVLVDSICYIESFNHKIVLHTTEGDVEYYARLRDLEAELAGQFYRIHKSFIVNLAHVEKYSKTQVLLVTGEKLIISKYRYADFVNAYIKYMEDKV